MDKVKCPICEQMKPRDTVYEMVDPFSAEIYNKEEVYEMCEDCYHESAMDI